jgi:hypothetical protein
MASLAHIVSPIRPGKLVLADRIAHAADRIISSNGEGEASRRDTAHPADVTASNSISNETKIDVLGRATRPSTPSRFAPGFRRHQGAVGVPGELVLPVDHYTSLDYDGPGLRSPRNARISSPVC